METNKMFNLKVNGKYVMIITTNGDIIPAKHKDNYQTYLSTDSLFEDIRLILKNNIVDNIEIIPTDF